MRSARIRKPYEERDETLLAEGRYREWFWDGLNPDGAAWLRMPVKAHKVAKPSESTHHNVGLIPLETWQAEQPKNWQHEAACVGTDPMVFLDESHYPEREFHKPSAKWRQLCPQCPVRETCLQAARDSESVGIFGGKLFHFDKKSGSIQEIDDGIPDTGEHQPQCNQQLHKVRQGLFPEQARSRGASFLVASWWKCST